jgi:hypothetical protein
MAAAAGSAAVPMGSSPHVRLLALHVLACAVRHLPSADLLAALPAVVAGVVPSLSSALVDIRKVRFFCCALRHPSSFTALTCMHTHTHKPGCQAVIFVLVEAYMVVGDALHPFVSALPMPQKKLLTIYIDKQMNGNKGGNGGVATVRGYGQ